MIEINLLPVELRQPEGTPLPRLASILCGALVFTLLCVLVANYYLVDIPRTDEYIRTKTGERDLLKVVEAEVAKLDEEIAKIKEKVAALRVLYNSRIKWWRLLDQFSHTIPDGCVVRSFHVTPEGGVPGEGAGKRYRLDFQGYASGENNIDCVKKLTELSKNLETVLVVPAKPEDKPGGAAPVSAATGASKLPPGYNEITKLKFEKPVIDSYPPVEIPELVVSPSEKKRYPPKPKAGLDFSMHMAFSLMPSQGP